MIWLTVSLLSCSMKFKWLLSFLGVRTARIEGFQKDFNLKPTSSLTPVIWFHAASVGELEMLRPLIDDFIAKGEKVGVSAFSDSALGTFDSLKASTVYAGLSPREGEWGSCFLHFQVKKLIISKYDLWPGLAAAASARDVPVIVVNARKSFSFLLLQILFFFSPQKMPRLFRFSPDLKFTEAKGSVDPRFERVGRRLDQRDSFAWKRVEEWKSKISNLPKPHALIGSAWMSDLVPIVEAFQNEKGTLVVVPHSLQKENLARMLAYLNENLAGRFVMVAEMGILVELYSLAAWIYVGGGFEKGIHSTLEASFYSVPLFCGPKNVDSFFETIELIEQGRLHVITSALDLRLSLQKWAQSPGSSTSSAQSKRQAYQELFRECEKIT